MSQLPQLTAANWMATRDTIKGYAQVVGKVRRALTPFQKHWWHVSLRVMAQGLTTTPIRIGEISAEIHLNLTTHNLHIHTNDGQTLTQSLKGQSARDLYQFVQDVFTQLGADLGEVDPKQFSDESSEYDPVTVQTLHAIFLTVYDVLTQLKHSFREESSPVQLWPHNFDMALLWLSGNRIDSKDPDDAENSDEQMNFGFEPGDKFIPEPYFYVTAYPTPDGLTDLALPEPAYWITEGFTGAILRYTGVESAEQILNFFQTVHTAGKAQMLG